MATNWTEGASCATVALDEWFPEVGSTPRRAKEICRGCPIVVACLKWALDNNEKWGVWGGTTYEERVRIRRREAA